MKNGLYALATLDGRPFDARDLAVMALDMGPDLRQATGCTLAARDVRASAVHTRVHADGIDALIGDLDEPADAARALGLMASSDPLTIACATLERYGADASTRLLGTWLLARWHAPSATLTLLMAEQVRDRCYVAMVAGRVAVAPELARLARLDWVDAAPDPRNTLLFLGKAFLRRAVGDGTIVRGVVRVMPGQCLTIRADGVARTTAAPWQGPETASPASFEDNIERIDAVLRRIMRQHFDRHGDTALLLSGGLDSSLLALIGALERGERRLSFITSVAPPGSGLADEREFATLVATHLGLPIELVAPPPLANIYRPSDRVFSAHEMPAISARHYLDEALQDAAGALGVGAVLDGSGGEMTVTSYADFFADPPRATPLRDAARAFRDRLRGRAGADRWPHVAFHPRLSRAAIDRLPSDFADLWRTGEPQWRKLRPDQPFGVEYGVTKFSSYPSTTGDATLRQMSPLFDRRLIRLVAGMPAGFATHDGLNRAPARALTQGRLPDAIALRQTRFPFSPNYFTLMRDQADVAIKRLPLYRTAGAGDWVDLEWLATAMKQVKYTQANNLDIMSELQSTAIAAEFFVWWQNQTI